MSVVAVLPTQAALEAAWERYAELARQAQDNPRLMLDRAHVSAMVRAHKAFADALVAMDERR